MRKLFIAGVTTLTCLAIGVAPAAAKPGKPPAHTADEFSYIATIDCGPGPGMVVGSGDNTSDPFVELQTGKRFFPIVWHVKWDGGGFDEVLPNPIKGGKRMRCSYDDGFATGFVVVVEERGGPGGPRGPHHHHHHHH